MNNHKVSAVSASALASVSRREPERSEGDRSATDANAVALVATRADPEVVLRRHGLYSSLVTTWRKEQESGALQALTPRKRGPKPTRDPLAEENQQLRRDIQQLTEDLRKADIVIDIQKKVAALLGRPILTPDLREKR